MRSVMTKGLKIEKKLASEMPRLVEQDLAPITQDSSEEVTKVDPLSVPSSTVSERSESKEDTDKKIHKKARRTSPVKAPIRAVAPKLGLKVSAGLNMGTIYPIKKRRNVMGRRLDAAFPIQDDRASRDHAVIEYKKGHFILSDLKSTNGTFLNNKAVSTPTYIKEGDHIRVGSTLFVVEIMDEKSPEMAQQWSSMTTIIPRAQILEKSKSASLNADEVKDKSEAIDSALRWKHLTKTLTKGQHKHLQHARIFGLALGLLMVAAAILTSL